tara:strand:- start:829 stop:1488 length:660 start_codon:yes stop_codon:yes gene_type:complete
LIRAHLAAEGENRRHERRRADAHLLSLAAGDQPNKWRRDAFRRLTTHKKVDAWGRPGRVFPPPSNGDGFPLLQIAARDAARDADDAHRKQRRSRGAPKQHHAAWEFYYDMAAIWREKNGHWPGRRSAVFLQFARDAFLQLADMEIPLAVGKKAAEAMTDADKRDLRDRVETRLNPESLRTIPGHYHDRFRQKSSHPVKSAKIKKSTRPTKTANAKHKTP